MGDAVPTFYIRGCWVVDGEARRRCLECIRGGNSVRIPTAEGKHGRMTYYLLNLASRQQLATLPSPILPVGFCAEGDVGVTQVQVSSGQVVVVVEALLVQHVPLHSSHVGRGCAQQQQQQQQCRAQHYHIIQLFQVLREIRNVQYVQYFNSSTPGLFPTR